MKNRKLKTLSIVAAIAAALSLSGCAKKSAQVSPPPPPSPTTPTVAVAASPSEIRHGQTSTLTSPTDEELFSRNVKDVFFDYDKAAIPENEAPTVQNNEAFLVQHPHIKVLIEGHCDDRGSEEYNIALGSSRAEAAKHALAQQGIEPSRIRTLSYGKEKPFCTEDNEQCWHQNRVDHFAFDR
jgi:peptidoglycan-associated lipoprotein